MMVFARFGPWHAVAPAPRLALLAAAVALSACATTTAGGGGRPAALRTLKRGSVQAPTADRVARSAAELAQLWADAGLRGDPPQLDFSKEMVVATFRGCLPNSCYGSHIVSFTSSGGGGEVWIEDVDPDPECTCALSITCPYHVVAVPRVEGNVGFHHRSASADCVRRGRP